MKGRVAFVYYPYQGQVAPLDSMPFAFDALRELATGWPVDLILWEGDAQRYKDMIGGDIRIRTIPTLSHQNIKKLEKPSRLNRITSARLRWEMKGFTGYSCVFSVGQIGAAVAATLCKRSGCPLIYFNDEFPSFWPNTTWQQAEREAVKLASVIVVPDEQRYIPLCEDLLVEPNIPFAVLPNVGKSTKPENTIKWHDVFKIPANKDIFLVAGSLGDWAQVPEILTTLPLWTEEAVLLLHDRAANGGPYRRQLLHLERPGRLYWSNKTLEEAELNSLVSACAASIALYRKAGPNIEYVGRSSGKIMRSILCGTPVIATNFPSLSFVREQELGILVDHPSELPVAVRRILEERSKLSDNCKRFTEESVTFSEAWVRFCETVNEATGLNLRFQSQSPSVRKVKGWN